MKPNFWYRKTARIVLHQFASLLIRNYDFVDLVYVVVVARDINTVDILRLEDVMFCVFVVVIFVFSVLSLAVMSKLP